MFCVDMNVFKSLQEYVTKILSVSGMKVLLLDQETTGMVSMVYSQSEIIAKQVFLVARCDTEKAVTEGKANARMDHLKAVIYMRPTRESISAIKKELRDPTYKEYHLFFSNMLTSDQLKQLAEADRHDLIRQVQEYYGDYYVLEETLFHCNLPRTRCLAKDRDTWQHDEHQIYERMRSCLLAALLSLKKRPIIRYQGSSSLAKALAVDITQSMKEESGLFHTQGQATLLLLDRRDDPVSPLLQQWTYQAMTHELLGIKNNRVDMSSVPGIRKELKEVVLSSQQDHFFKGSMHLNFGELGRSIKDLVQDYQRKTKNNSKMDSIEDMQRFVDNYPEFRAMSGNVSKHVSVMTELSRLVELRKLLTVSELEQELACTQDHATALESILTMLNDTSIRFDEKLRLVMLYGLRYEKVRNDLASLKDLLRDKASTDAEQNKIKAVEEVLKWAGSSVRGGDLFNNKSFLSKASSIFTGLKGVENIYTRHRPLLASTLDQVLKGKLKASEMHYPFVDAASNSNSANKKAQHVIVFIIGGVSYAEHLAVSELNTSEGDSGVRIVLGGSSVHNTKSFLEDLIG